MVRHTPLQWGHCYLWRCYWVLLKRPDVVRAGGEEKEQLLLLVCSRRSSPRGGEPGSLFAKGQVVS